MLPTCLHVHAHAMVSLHEIYPYHPCFTAHCFSAILVVATSSTPLQQPLVALGPHSPAFQCVCKGLERKVIRVAKRVGKIPRSPDSDLEAIIIAEQNLDPSPGYFFRSRSPSVAGRSPDSLDYTGSLVQIDAADQAATDAARAASEQSQPAKGKGRGKSAFALGKGKHWSSQFVNVDRNRPFAVETAIKITPAEEIGFNWNEYVDKFGQQQYRTEDGIPPPDRLVRDYTAREQTEGSQEQATAKDQPPVPPSGLRAEAADAAAAAAQQGQPPKASPGIPAQTSMAASPHQTTQPPGANHTVEQAIEGLMSEQQLVLAS
jgi:hypothetical protein